MLRYGLPMPKLQYPIRVEGFLFHPDFAYPQIRLAIEAQGEVHRQRNVFLRDPVRFSKLNEAGWSLLLVTDDEFDRNLSGLLSPIAKRLAKAA